MLSENEQMLEHHLVLRRLLQCEQTLSQSYRYSTHVQVLNAFALLPWLVCTETLVDKILPVLESRIKSVGHRFASLFRFVFLLIVLVRLR